MQTIFRIGGAAILIVLIQVAGAGAWIIRNDATGGDCTSIGTWDAASGICTLNTDITETIEIRGSHLTLDGQDHTISGSNTGSGIIISEGEANPERDIIVKNNVIKNFFNGIFIDSAINIRLENNEISMNDKGIAITIETCCNIIVSNKIHSNNIGIHLVSDQENLIYNNFFNNINNFHIGAAGPIWGTTNWNIPIASGPNIIGGPDLGGNFWAQPDGHGFSQECLDTTPADGICDSEYHLDSLNVNIDHLPLAYIAQDVIPEFPIISLPILSVMFLVFLFKRKTK